MTKVLMISTMAGALFMSGCATKAYVRQQVDEKLQPVNKKITDLTASVKDNSERIDAVDRRATQGITDAAAARTAATGAQTTATAAQTSANTAQTAANGAQRTADTVNQGLTASNVRITTVENRLNNLPQGDRLNPGPVQTVTFKVNSAMLSDDAKRTLDSVAASVANLAGGYQIEIQGYASAEGKEDKNVALSQARSESVQRYLVSKNVSLVRTTILGVGPIGDKKAKEADLAPNRKVDVRVFRAQ